MLNSGAIMPDLSWHFLNIRFRRRLNQSSLEGSTVGPMVSPWTQPAWVQILPPANFWHLGEDGASVAVSEMLLDTASKTVVAGTQRIAVAASASPIFVTDVLLTQSGTDAFGHRNQESFLACVKLADLTGAPPEVWAVPAPDLRGRLLELQMRPDAPAVSNIWDTLFPQLSSDGPMRKDVTVRIVRMSGAIASR